MRGLFYGGGSFGHACCACMLPVDHHAFDLYLREMYMGTECIQIAYMERVCGRFYQYESGGRRDM